MSNKTPKFKVGDKVRVTNHIKLEGEQLKYLGKVGSVQNSNFFPNVRFLDGEVIVFFEDKLEPTSMTIKEENELVELVRRANDGLHALETLHKTFYSEVETFGPSNGSEVSTVRAWYEPAQPRIRIKPKPAPKFPELTIGVGAVFVEGEMVKVGCKQFPLSIALKLLSDLVRFGAYGQSQAGSHVLQASREGAVYEGNVITWEDADRLLAALEDYQQQLKECA